jgi:hypothetical protein
MVQVVSVIAWFSFSQVDPVDADSFDVGPAASVPSPSLMSALIGDLALSSGRPRSGGSAEQTTLPPEDELRKDL